MMRIIQKIKSWIQKRFKKEKPNVKTLEDIKIECMRNAKKYDKRRKNNKIITGIFVMFFFIIGTINIITGKFYSGFFVFIIGTFNLLLGSYSDLTSKLIKDSWLEFSEKIQINEDFVKKIKEVKKLNTKIKWYKSTVKRLNENARNN